jgi:hypothetical protein
MDDVHGEEMQGRSLSESSLSAWPKGLFRRQLLFGFVPTDGWLPGQPTSTSWICFASHGPPYEVSRSALACTGQVTARSARHIRTRSSPTSTDVTALSA